MSTRAVYTFKDADSTVHVYKHHDGYPEGGLSWIANALPHAWDLPRFEADEFAAAFVAANKESGGGVRLFPTRITEPHKFASDAEFHYIIQPGGKTLQITIKKVDWWKDTRQSETIFSGTLDDAIKQFGASWIKEPEAA